jgi:hypothetical protein
MRARLMMFLPATVSVFVWTSSSIDAQQKPQTRRPDQAGPRKTED